MAGRVPRVATPEGRQLPFIFDKPHSVGGLKVPQPMLYPSREMIEAKMRAVPRGTATGLPALRADLAAEHGTETTCPVTTQRLVRDIVEAAFVAWQQGRRDVPPFWRVLDPERPTTDRLAGGAAFVRERQAAER